MNAAAKVSETSDWSLSLQIFVGLQALDLFTTLSGLRIGLQEASPFIQILMRLGASFGAPGVGVLGGKILAVLLGGFCVWTGRARVIRWINCWYTVLVAWNFALIFLIH